jgi:hypothetical protein
VFVAAAWFASADLVPVQAQTVILATPVVSSAATGGCGSGGCSSCGQDACCTESWGHRLKARLSGLFQRNNDCCDSCGGNTWGHHQAGSGSCCQPAPTTCCAQTCDTCDQGCGHKFFGRLKGLFNRGNSGCCDTCSTCNSCGASGTSGTVIPYGTVQPKTGEPLPPPKGMPNKMPEGKEPPPIKGAGIEAPFPTIPAQIAPPTAPALQPAPAITPAIPADLYNKEPRPF